MDAPFMVDEMTKEEQETKNDYQRLLRLAFPEDSARYFREYRRRRPEQTRILSKRHRQSIDPVKRREAAKKRYHKSVERYRDKSSRWRARNRDKLLAGASRRRSLYKANDCSSRISEILSSRTCYWCGKSDITPAIDHVIPLFRGGPHSADNLVGACKSCNSSKGSKLVHEWDEFLGC